MRFAKLRTETHSHCFRASRIVLASRDILNLASPWCSKVRITLLRRDELLLRAEHLRSDCLRSAVTMNGSIIGPAIMMTRALTLSDFWTESYAFLAIGFFATALS